MDSREKNHTVKVSPLLLLSIEFAFEYAAFLSKSIDEAREIVIENEAAILEIMKNKGFDLEVDVHRQALLKHVLSAYFDATGHTKNPHALKKESLQNDVKKPMFDENNGVYSALQFGRPAEKLLGTDTDFLYALKGVVLTDYEAQLKEDAAIRRVNVLRPIRLDHLKAHLEEIVYPCLPENEKIALSIPVANGDQHNSHWYALHLDITKKLDRSIKIDDPEVVNSMSSTSDVDKKKFEDGLGVLPKFKNTGAQKDALSCMDHAAQSILKGVYGVVLTDEQEALRDENDSKRLRERTIDAICAADPALKRVAAHDDSVDQAKKHPNPAQQQIESDRLFAQELQRLYEKNRVTHKQTNEQVAAKEKELLEKLTRKHSGSLFSSSVSSSIELTRDKRRTVRSR